MKRKDIVKNKRQFARLVANLDGKYAGLNHKDIEKAFTFIIALETTARIAGYKSPLVMLKAKAIKKAAAFKKKAKK